MNPILLGLARKPEFIPKSAEPIAVPARIEHKPDEDEEDSSFLLSGLSSIAHRDPEVKIKPKKKKRKQNSPEDSRFWDSQQKKPEAKATPVKELVAKRKAQFKPKTLEHIDADVQERLKIYKKELPDKLRSNIELIRDFFLSEIGPLVMAVQAGTFQSKEVVEQLLGSKVDSALYGKFEQMSNRATVLKLRRFVLTYFDLPESDLDLLLGSSGQESENSKLIRIMKDMLKQGPETPAGVVSKPEHKRGNRNGQERTRPSRR